MKNSRSLAITLILSGIIIMIFSTYFWMEKSKKFDNYDGKARGNIIKYIRSGEDRLPMLRFKYENQDFTFIDTSASLVDRTKDSTDILFKKSNPNDALMYDSYDTWGAPLSIGIVGFFISFFGYIIYRVGRKE